MFDFGEAKRIEWPITKRGVTYNFHSENDRCTIICASIYGSMWYEVFEKRVNKEYEIAGNKIPAKEAFPNDESFGKWARCALSLESANFWARELADRAISRDAERASRDSLA